jgi:competence ComEA-like helix-hairpin-helix protein
MKKVFVLFFLLFLACPLFVLAEQIDINSATLSQLDELTGIGPKYAQAIIDARPFSSLDDLLRVKGIGPKTLQKIKDQGLAYVSGQQVIQPVPAPQAPATDENSVPVKDTALSQSLAQEPTEAPGEPTGTISYPTGVFINEIMPNPAGPDETDEWFEVLNTNSSDVDLSGWQVKDITGTISTYTLPQGAKILANSFLVFRRPETNIMLNNDQDGLNLLTPDKKIIDSVNFTTAPLGQSYNKVGSVWQWSTTLTPGAKNIIAAIAKILPKTTKSDNNKANVAVADLSGATDINQEQSSASNPWFLFFIASGITVISATAILLIKLKFQKNVRT